MYEVDIACNVGSNIEMKTQRFAYASSFDKLGECELINTAHLLLSLEFIG
jgi:hypothetical protein